MKREPSRRRIVRYAAFVAGFVAVGALIPHFLSPANLLNVVRQSSIIGICAVGMTLVIIIKGIDLSLSGLLAFAPMVSGLLMLSGVAIPFALAAGIAAGVVMGLFNGLMVSKLSVPSFITTLVVGQVSQGLALVMNGGRSIGAFPERYVFLGNGVLLGVPISDYLMVAFLLLGLFIMKGLPLGSHILALGGNETVLRQEGLSITRLQLFVFAFSGFCAGVAGLLLSAQLDTVHPIQGEAYQLDAIAACIIGGVDLAGGSGSVPMAVLGALVIGCLRNALNLLGVHPFMQNIFVGIIIVGIVFASGQLRRRAALATRGGVVIEASVSSAPAPSVGAPRPRSAKEVLSAFARENGSLLILAVLAVLAALFVPSFASTSNALLIVKQSAIPVIACIGMTLVLMTGGIDLSLGFVVGLASIVSGILAKTFAIPAPVALAATLAVGALLGLVNGCITQLMRVPAFIATLGTGYAIYGLSQIISRGSIINRLPKPFLAIGRTDVLGLPSTVAIAAVVAIAFYVLINRSTFGRRLRAFGHSARAAELSGVPTASINVLVYVLCSTLAALAGLLLTIRVNAAQPNMGGGVFTFEVVTAAIVGGTSLFGGVGSVTGSLFGVLAIKIVENCINLLGVSHHLYLAVQGVVILVAIVLENVKNRSL